MKTLVFKQPEWIQRYPEDVEQIVLAFAEQGYTVSRRDAQAAWEQYSDMFCASWLSLLHHDNESIINRCMNYLVEATPSGQEKETAPQEGARDVDT